MDAVFKCIGELESGGRDNTSRLELNDWWTRAAATWVLTATHRPKLARNTSTPASPAHARRPRTRGLPIPAKRRVGCSGFNGWKVRVGVFGVGCIELRIDDLLSIGSVYWPL